jgi:excisionase family DNA binding protein
VLDTILSHWQANVVSGESSYITTSQVSSSFGVNPATVRRWVATGKVKPAVTTPGGHYRFRAEDIEQLVLAGCVERRTAIEAGPGHSEGGDP